MGMHGKMPVGQVYQSLNIWQVPNLPLEKLWILSCIFGCIFQIKSILFNSSFWVGIGKLIHFETKAQSFCSLLILLMGGWRHFVDSDISWTLFFKMSTKCHPKRGHFCPRDVTKSVREMSPLLSTRSCPLCPRDVCHPLMGYICISSFNP